jgi:hypothetical protein
MRFRCDRSGPLPPTIQLAHPAVVHAESLGHLQARLPLVERRRYPLT